MRKGSKTVLLVTDVLIFAEKILKPQKGNWNLVQHGQSICTQELLQQLLYFYILAAKNKI